MIADPTPLHSKENILSLTFMKLMLNDSSMAQALLNKKDHDIYLELMMTFITLHRAKKITLEEGIVQLENQLKIIVQKYKSEIERNTYLTKTLDHIVKCLIKLKLLEKSSKDFERQSIDVLNSFKLINKKTYSVMSNLWLKKTLEKHLKNTKTFKFILPNFTITSEGLARFQQLTNSAFNEEKETIDQDDLALLGMMFGRHQVKKLMNRYGLKNDGSYLLPFTKNNLRALLIGLTTSLEDEQLHQEARAVLTTLRRNISKKKYYLQNLEKEFTQQAQNKSARNAKNTAGKTLYEGMHLFINLARKYLQNKIINYVNIFESKWTKKWMKENSTKLLNKINTPNEPLIHLLEDIELLEVNDKIKEYVIEPIVEENVKDKIDLLFNDLITLTPRVFRLKHPEYRDSLSSEESDLLNEYRNVCRKNAKEPSKNDLYEKVKAILISKISLWDKYADNIMLDLKTLSFKKFTTKYPFFNQANNTPGEFEQLRRYSVVTIHGLEVSNRGQLIQEKRKAEEQVKQFILQKLTSLYPFARATLFSHILPYAKGMYSANKSNIQFHLPMFTGVAENFTLNSIIQDEGGMAMSLFSPQKALNADGTIPLYIMFEGTHDLAGALRDLHPVSTGTDEFNPNNIYVEKILTALNKEIDTLTKKFPNKKVSIEIFGHSLGGADSHECLLLLQEAMSQNKARSANGYQDYVGLCDPKNRKGFCHAKDLELRETLPQALTESLGLRNRDFGQGYKHDRTYRIKDIQEINIDNIANIKLFTKNSAGCHKKTLSAIAATAAFLGKSGYTVYNYPLDVDGDPVQRTNYGRGFGLTHPETPFFKNAIETCHGKVDSNKGKTVNRLLHLLDGRVAPLEAHQGLVFENGPLNFAQQDIKITPSISRQNIAYLKNELINPVKIQRRNVVDSKAYQALKTALYTLLSLTKKLAQPFYNMGKKSLTILGGIEKQGSSLFKVISPKPEKTSLMSNETRSTLLAEQKQCLFMAVMPTISAPQQKEHAIQPRRRRNQKVR